MSMIDIREEGEPITSIKFSDFTSSTAVEKAYYLEYFVPVQFNIVSKTSKVHVRYEDINDLIKALQFARANWGG